MKYPFVIFCKSLKFILPLPVTSPLSLSFSSFLSLLPSFSLSFSISLSLSPLLFCFALSLSALPPLPYSSSLLFAPFPTFLLLCLTPSTPFPTPPYLPPSLPPFPVRRVPPRFSILPSSHEIMPGGSVNITCVAVGSPMPYVKWMLGNEDLTPEDEMPIGRNVLELNGVRESANYTCVAMSSLGIIEASSQVLVKSKSPTDLWPLFTTFSISAVFK